MYRRLKSTLRRLVGRQALYRLEPVIRYFHSRLYLGTEYHCNICETGLKTFIKLDNGNNICPRCGSADRDRRLWDLVKQNHLEQNQAILDFSPSRSLYRKFKSLKNLNYFSSDLSGDFLAEESFDITRINTPSSAFDLILCYHILEHVEKDLNAMSELFRVLKPGGHCLIQTPFKDGEIYEDFSITSAEERLEHFGQEDHVRIYSVSGLKNRLSKAGFEVEVLHFEEKANNKAGFKTNEFILSCTKATKSNR